MTLVELAGGDDPSGCWDPNRAVSLLRSQSSPEELKAIGVGEEFLRIVWPEVAEGRRS